MKHTALLCAAAALIALTAAASAQARPMTADDLATMARVAEPVASPDGRWVVYQQSDTDAASYARTTGLWLVGTAPASQPVRIADIEGANESTPAFSADGRRLYFLSGQSGKDQLWFVDVAADGRAGTPVQASDTVAEVAGYRLSPAGNAVLLWGDIADGCPQFGCEGNADTSSQGPGSGRTYDHELTRHWDTWETPGVHSRAFTFGLGANGRVSGAPVAIGAELVGDTPSKPFGGSDELAFSADGRTVYFTLRIADANEARSTNLDIYAAPANGGPATNLTAANAATDTLPAPSPDGRWLAYAAMARAGYEADRQVVMLRDVRSAAVRALTQGWDRSVDSIAWSADSRSLIVTAQDTLQHPAFRVDVRSGAVTPLTSEGSVSSVTALRDGSLVYAHNSVTHPTEVMLRFADGRSRALSHANDARMAELDAVVAERFSFAGANGERVWGQILTPPTAATHVINATTHAITRPPLPTILLVHGGPQSSFGNGWSTRWNPMLFASAGFAVVTIDFHGSTGYGQAFTDSINRNWGGSPLEDLRLGMAAAASVNSAVNPTNACAAGGSYGGYMMNWIAGQWSDGFKCLVTHAGIFDMRAMAFETEEIWFDEWDNGGPWWRREQAERWNPVNHVANWRTPSLIIHGERDYRIPYSQSLAAFHALQRQGVPSRLLVYPDENHWILKGRNSVQWYREVLGWITRWTAADAPAQPARWPAPPAQP
ncbi:MAG: S9 family peptidase [Sphingopyxis sp.]